MTSNFYPVYPVLDLESCELASVDPQQLLALWEGLGLTYFQLRAKNLSQGAYFEAAQRLSARTRLALIANDHWQLAQSEPLFSGIHLGQSDLQSVDPAWPAQSRLAKGLSTHNRQELQEALSGPWDYVALGPCFPGGRGRKEIMEPFLSAAELQDCLDLKASSSFRGPLILIGGIQAANFPLHRALPVPAAIGAAMESDSLQGLIKKVEEARACFCVET